MQYSLDIFALVPNPIYRGYGRYPAEGLEVLFRVYLPGQESHFHGFVDSARLEGHRQEVRLYFLSLCLAGIGRCFVTAKLPKLTLLSCCFDGFKVFSTLCEQAR